MISETLRVVLSPVGAGGNVGRALPRKKEKTGPVDAIHRSSWQRTGVGWS